MLYLSVDSCFLFCFIALQAHVRSKHFINTLLLYCNSVQIRDTGRCWPVGRHRPADQQGMDKNCRLISLTYLVLLAPQSAALSTCATHPSDVVWSFCCSPSTCEKNNQPVNAKENSQSTSYWQVTHPAFRWEGPEMDFIKLICMLHTG